MNPFAHLFGSGSPVAKKLPRASANSADINFGKTSHDWLGFDATPGFNLTKSAPFVGRTGGGATPQAASSGGSGGGGNAPQTSAPSVDPYAAYGGQQAYNNLVSGFDTQKQGIYDTSNAAAGTYGSQYGRGILDFLDSQRQGQKNIDTQAAKNELAKIQGVSGILGMVGRGIQSGGVMLAGKNAGNSSAAQGIANAYAQQGRRQLGNVGNQYALGNQDIQNAQENYGIQQASGVRNLQGGKNDAINDIVNQAQEKFYALDAQMASASLPDRIAIEQEKQNVRSQVMQQLQQFDSQLNQGVQGIHASSQDERRAKAQQLASQGTDLGAGAFDYTTETPGQFLNGPFASDLPLFSVNKRKFA